ncbi:MAG: guanylate kinase [Candidatus Peribacteraceae bacterium]|nr:guanylate kinase [Candidatus Peribacteraceae bacterium]
MPAGKLVLIIGPSGVGKSVILKTLRDRHPEFVFPRSATTRPRRDGEGDDLYRFVTDAEFDGLLKENKVLEWATVHAGARYGTLVDEIVPFIEKGRTVIREVDVQGFDSIRKHELFTGTKPKYPLQSIFILPESKEQLIKHITDRAPIAEDELKRRIASMEKELAYAKLCTASVKNIEGKLEETLRDVESLIGA